MYEYRIYGPPGTGKTTWIAQRAASLAADYGADQVSICSLTRAAVREVAGRDLPLPDENITTLHSRCKRALLAGKPAESEIRDFAKKYPNYATAECIPQDLLRKVESDRETDDESILSGGRTTFYQDVQILRQQLVPKEKWPVRVAHWGAVWSEWCASMGLLDFTGWLEACNGTGVLPPQQALFVDEAQDHTPLQLAVLRGWDVQHLFLVGDDDQNLYEWSGAVPREFLKTDLPPEREKVLSQSYRVPRSVHALASKWISRARYRKVKEYSPRDYDGEVIYSGYRLSSAKTGNLPEFVGGEEKTMILTSCMYMLNDVISELKYQGVPFHNPYRRASPRWNPLERPLPIIRSLMVGERDWTGFEAERWAGVLSERMAFCGQGKKREFTDECRKLGLQSVPESLLDQCLSDEAVDMVLSQDLLIFDKMRMVGATGDWAYAIRCVEHNGVDLKPRVIVGTIHSVKGGEADNVILFPDLSQAGTREYLSPASEDRILRLFYVGMTRARDRLILCEASSPLAVSWIEG